MISNKDYHQGLLQYIGENRKPNDDLSPWWLVIPYDDDDDDDDDFLPIPVHNPQHGE